MSTFLVNGHSSRLNFLNLPNLSHNELITSSVAPLYHRLPHFEFADFGDQNFEKFLLNVRIMLGLLSPVFEIAAGFSPKKCHEALYGALIIVLCTFFGNMLHFEFGEFDCRSNI